MLHMLLLYQNHIRKSQNQIMTKILYEYKYKILNKILVNKIHQHIKRIIYHNQLDLPQGVKTGLTHNILPI